MPVYQDLPVTILSTLRSNDYPNKTISDLHRADYLNRAYVFEGLAADIAKNGIKEPLRVANGVLVNGHHRAIIALELGLESVPIEYSGYLPAPWNIG